MFLKIHGQTRWCQTKGKGRSSWGQQVWPRLNCLSNTSQVEEEPLNYSFSSCPKKRHLRCRIADSRCQQEEEEGCCLSSGRATAIGCLVLQFHFPTLRGEGDKPPAALSAGQLRGRGPWTDATRASEATGEPSAELMGRDQWRGGSASSSEGPGGVVRRPRGVDVIRGQPGAPRWAQEVPGSRLSLGFGEEGS